MKWVYDDGGRRAAGYAGLTNDCVCRAIAIATERDYKTVYDELNHRFDAEHHRKISKYSDARTGVCKPSMRSYMQSIGWKWLPTMGIGTGCKVHMRESELPKGRIIVQLSKHSTAVIDGVLHDTHDCTRDETRCVYGYYYK